MAKKNASILDLLELEPQEQIGSFIKSARQEMSSHQVFFDEDIGTPAKYRDLINLLYMSDENTEFNFFMNTGGGIMSSAMAIVEAMKASDAKTRAIIVGDCHSAGSIIALNADEVVVTESAIMMCHTASYGTGGNAHNVKTHTDFSTVYINKIVDATYAGFLNETEITELKKGVEMWLHSEDIVKRLELRHTYLKKQHDAAVAKAKKTPPTTAKKK